jgi:hypothetical protein
MPTVLDNGQRSPRKLLRKVVVRLLAGCLVQSADSAGVQAEAGSLRLGRGDGVSA